MSKKPPQQHRTASPPAGAGAPSEQVPAPAAVPEAAPRINTKTPLFQAMHAERYQRQSIIKQIQKEVTQRRLICYVAGNSALISRDDTLGGRRQLSWPVTTTILAG